MTDSDQNPPSGEDVFEVERIRQLVELMEKCELTEIDLKREDQRIRLRRGGETEIASFVAPQMMNMPQAAAPTPAAPAPLAEEDANIVYIKSPMVGTFYAKANPDAPSFIERGQLVSSDTTVCIVEAMKVFNEIKAECSGTVVDVLCENEDAVEFNQPMFKVDTSK